MLSVGIVGGTGYTGVELLRILAAHPKVQLEIVTSRSEAGNHIFSLYPSLRSAAWDGKDLKFTAPNIDSLKQCDCVFFAAPNGTAMKMVPDLLTAGVKVIDLAADFRINDVHTWEHWYKQSHACPDLLASAVYGLPEINRQRIKSAQLVANPGCYPTAVILGFLPLLETNLTTDSILIADAKSGVSGAGRAATIPTLFSEAGENFKAYNVSAHRHWPEIKQELEKINVTPLNFNFTPHLVPMVRGIYATLYVSNIDVSIDLHSLYKKRYAKEYFVTVLENGNLPETKYTRGSNHCMISVQRSQDGEMTVVLSVIDNLVKGAAGQAVQNMNLMHGYEEFLGLTQSGLFP